MDTDIIQFPYYLPEVKISHSSNQLGPGTDTNGYFSDSPPFSPSCQLHLLRLSSESDDCLEIHSPFSPYSMEIAITDDNPCKKEGQIQRHQEKVSFDSGSQLRNKFVSEMESMNGKEIAIKSGQESETSKISRSNSLNPRSEDKISSSFNQLTEKLTSKQSNSCKDQTRGPRRDSVSEVKKESDSESPAMRENTSSSHLSIPSSSHLALRRKLKRQASRDLLPAESRERKDNMSCPTSLKSPRKSPVPTTRKTDHSTRASKSPRSVVIKGGHIGDHENPRVPRPSTRKTRVGSTSAGKGSKQEKPSPKDSQTETRTREKYGEAFEERNRKATLPFLPKICQPNRFSCPVFQKSHWKSPKESPVFAARDNSQLTRASNSPRSAKAKRSYFVYPETLLVPRTPTRKIRLGSSGALKSRRMSKGHESEGSKAKDDQKETKTSQEKQGETSHSRQHSVPSLPKICQPRQQCQSRDQMGSILPTSAGSYAEAPQGPLHRSPRFHVARQSLSSSLGIPGEKTSTRNTNVLPSHSVIPSTSHLALRRKLKRENSNPLTAESREESSKSKDSLIQAST